MKFRRTTLAASIPAVLFVGGVVLAAGPPPGYPYPIDPSGVAAYPSPITYHQQHSWVIDGDEVDAPNLADGGNGTSWTSWVVSGTGAIGKPSFAQLIGGSNFLIYPIALPGQTCATMVANAAANVYPLRTQVGDAGNAITESVATFGCGANDIRLGTAATTIEGYYVTYGTGVKGSGYTKVVCRTIVQGTGVTSSVQSAVNVYLRANTPASWCDVLYDPANNPQLGEPYGYADPVWFNPDQMTLNANGTWLYGSGWIAAVKAALGL